MRDHSEFALDFARIRMTDVDKVGGKNASLGELFNTFKSKGVGVLDGFATTAGAYRSFLEMLNLKQKLLDTFKNLDVDNLTDLARASEYARDVVMETPLPISLCDAILDGYARLCGRSGRQVEVAVRSSATAEDLPEASFAGAAETFLNVRGEADLLEAVHRCFASVFTDRAVSYRAKMGFDQLSIALSVGVMPMVRADKASSGVMFTLDPESGFRNAIVITGSYGLGEYVVQGVVTPDEWTVFKPSLKAGFMPIIDRRLGTKEVRLIYSQGAFKTVQEPTPPSERDRFSLTDEEVIQLATWGCIIEAHYSALAGRERPMDIEWAKDGISGALYIVQARPETVHSARAHEASRVFRLASKPGAPLVRGQAVGEKIGTGAVRVVLEAAGLAGVRPGDVLVARKTDPDWEPVMRRVAAIVTDEGGRTAHAAIVSREFGVPCIVGTGNATKILQGGAEVTVSCAEGAEGHVYAGRIAYTTEEVGVAAIEPTKTGIMLTLGDPAQAFSVSGIPNAGVGLARTEFIINNHIGVHPMALVRYPDLKTPGAAERIAERLKGVSPQQFFVQRLSEGIARIAAAFYPKPVIVRMSDFKTNEYARLLGGEEFEPAEENPMLGFRGASRYYDERYREGFALECRALIRVRDEMGLTNVKVMIPFCRTVSEGRRVLEEMKRNGLNRDSGLEVYAMCEIPSNVILAREFLQVFDGFSIGSNDLTQLMLGIDRDSGTVAHMFDERNDAVLLMISRVIEAAHAAHKHIGICGQAPSDYPDFAEWLVVQGIDSISLNPDVAVKVALRVADAEKKVPV